jgi:plasmid stabilization system protein ParE
MNLRYRKRAVGEVADIYEWYEKERQGLGEEFLAEFETLVKSIVEFPQSFSRFNANVRRAALNRFPYNVFYQIEAKRIVVLAVIHSARHPKSWPPAPKRTR